MTTILCFGDSNTHGTKPIPAQDMIDRLGPAIRRSAERLGTAFLDAGEHIEVSPIDGLHYDAATHATLGKAIAAAVRELATGSTKA